MKKRAFGKTGVEVTEVGLGCWQLGGSCWGGMDRERAFEIMRTAVDEGIRFFDTADVYGPGQSEEFIGRFLKDCAEEIFVATKVGRYPEPGWPGNFEMDVMRRQVEASLRRLQVECIDLLQLHSLNMEQITTYGLFDKLRVLQKEGKIRRFGASVESMDEALACLEYEGLTSLQIIFNIFRQKPIDVLFDKAKTKGVALIIRLPLASGLLSGKLTKESKFGEGDHRTFNVNGQAFSVGETFAGLGLGKGVEHANAIKKWVPAGMKMAQMAMRWILDYDAVSVVIPGASRAEQVVSNASASELAPLSEELHERLRRFYETKVKGHIRGKY